MRNRSLLIPALALALTLLVTALLVTPAFAQDETPIPEPTPVGEVPPEVPLEAGAEIPAELAGTAEELLPEEASSETPLEALAMEDLTLVDGSGEPLAMASEEAAGALAAGDVYFNVGTIKYTFTSIQQAVDYIRDNGTIPSDGAIHVEGPFEFANQNISIDGSINQNVNKIKALIGYVNPNTLKPGIWLSGSSSIDICKMTSGAGFLLSGFNIDSTTNFALQVTDSTGPLRLVDIEATSSSASGYGVFVLRQKGSVEFTRVDASNNGGQGAEIQNYVNTDSTYLTGPITITNSSFNRNLSSTYFSGGLTITTGGSVTLQGITVSNNNFGLHIIHAGNVTIKNSVFNNNLGAGYYSVWLEDTTGEPILGNVVLDNVVVNGNNRGLLINTYGNISANKVLVNSNANAGALFNTCGVENAECHPYYYGTITISNSNFESNGASYPEPRAGLRIWSRGAVALTNVSASGNTAGAGALVHTNNSRLVSPVTITGGTFNDNATYGLEVLSKGTITMSKVKASGNLGGYGAKLVNDYDGATAGVVVKGTLVGDNAFDNNGVNAATNNDGLYIRTNGAVTLGYLSASGNRGMGLNLEKTTNGVGAVTISKGAFDNNGLQGILAISKGAIKLTTVSASGNMARGADLQNTISTAAPGVTITGGDFNHNQGTGLYVRSNGAIALKTTQASDNSAHNMAFPVATAQTVHDTLGLEGNIDRWTVDVNNGDSATFTLRTQEWEMQIELFDPDNISRGVYTLAYDPGNNDYFVDLNASFDKTGTWSVAISNPERTFYSGVYHLSYSLGAAGDAYYDYLGADLDNTSGTTAGVTIANAAFPQEVMAFLVGLTDVTLRDFNSNSGTGLKIRTNGAIALTNLKAQNNGAKGVDLNNVPGSGTATPAVTITKGQYDANGDTGLDVASRGVITLKDVQSSSNRATFQGGADGYGIRIVNSGAGKAVSIINPPASYGGIQSNAKDGLVITSLGAITLTNIFTNYNNGYGLMVNNTSGAGNLTLSNAYAYDNTEDGIHATIKGAITLKSVDVWGNDGWGAYLHNDQVSTGAPAVTITNNLMYGMAYQGFGINTIGGLDILTRGPVTLTNVNVYDNTGTGAVIANDALGSYDVKINNCYFDGNLDDGSGGGYGLQVTSMGSIILNKGSASGNFLRGADLDNGSFGTTPIKAVTVSNFVFDDNGATGLGILSNGVVTLTNIAASDNTYYGASITKAGSVSVKYSGSGLNTFNNNGYSGLNIRTSGTVSLAKVNAISNNAGYGAQIGADEARVSNVTVSASKFDQNSMSGLLIYSLGTVTLTGVTAFDNTSVGAYILNNTALTPKTVVVNKSTFTENSTGLLIYSMGAVTLNGITALDNGVGTSVNNTYGTSGVSVLSSLGANTFNGNSSRGLYIQSMGNVILSNVTASNNGNHGIDIDNYQSDAGFGSVMLTKVTTWSNTYRGINILTKGVVTMDGISSVMNGAGGYSGILMNTYGHNFSIKNSLVTSNGAYGIHATLGAGTFTITNTFYFGNSTAGSVENILID